MSPHIHIGPEPVLAAHARSLPAAGSRCPAGADSAPHSEQNFFLLDFLSRHSKECSLYVSNKHPLNPLSPSPLAHSFIIGPAVINTHTVERVFKFRYSWFGYVIVKFGLHKGYPLLYYTWGGSRRLLLKMRPPFGPHRVCPNRVGPYRSKQTHPGFVLCVEKGGANGTPRRPRAPVWGRPCLIRKRFAQPVD
jgi:hypothetical protein